MGVANGFMAGFKSFSAGENSCPGLQIWTRIHGWELLSPKAELTTIILLMDTVSNFSLGLFRSPVSAALRPHQRSFFVAVHEEAHNWLLCVSRRMSFSCYHEPSPGLRNHHGRGKIIRATIRGENQYLLEWQGHCPHQVRTVVATVPDQTSPHSSVRAH